MIIKHPVHYRKLGKYKKIREQKYLSHLNIFPVLKITVVNILTTFNLSISI